MRYNNYLLKLKGKIMQFKLNIHCNNAAFGDTQEDANVEVAAILRKLAQQIEDGFRTVYVNDTNGNGVGYAEFDTVK